MRRSRFLLLLAVLGWSCTRAPRAAEPAAQAGNAFAAEAAAPAAPALEREPGEYVGFQHGPELPAGLEDLGGALMNDAGATEYALEYLGTASRQMLWLSRFTHQDPQGHPHWDVRDVLEIPALAPGETLSFGGFCRIDGARDAEVVAVVVARDGESLAIVRRAWRADRMGERFEEIPTAGVVCENEGFDA